MGRSRESLTAYDELRHLDSFLGIVFHAAFELWNILIISASGPIAVAVGAHRTNAILNKHDQLNAFGLSAATALTVSLLTTATRSGLLGAVLKLVFSCKCKQRRVVIDRERYVAQSSSGFGSYSRKVSNKHMRLTADTPDICGSPILSMLVSYTTMILALLLGIGLYCGLVFGLTALGATLYLGEVPLWLLWAALPAGWILIAMLSTTHSPSSTFPWEIPITAVCAVIFAKICDVQDHRLCSLADAAPAGAAAGVMPWLAGLPLSALLKFPCGHLDAETPQNRWSRRLFPPYREEQPASQQFQEEVPDPFPEHKLREAIEFESSQLQQHPDKTKVFWSRPQGVDKAAHYVLIIGDRKYELRDVSPKHNRSQVVYQTAVVAYERHGLHSAQLWDPSAPASNRGSYDLLLIGWTSLSHTEIDRICAEVGSSWKYRLLFSGRKGGNCQHFLRVVGEKVVDKDLRATNWEWFRHDRMGAIQYAQDVELMRYRAQRNAMDRGQDQFPGHRGMLHFGEVNEARFW